MTRASWLVGLGLLSGCGGSVLSPVSVQDDQGRGGINLAPGTAGDELHQPYGVGAEVRWDLMHALPGHDHSNHVAQVTGPATAVISNQGANKDGVTVNLRFTAPGVTQVTLWNDSTFQQALRVVTVESVFPNDAQVFPAARTLTDPNWAEHPQQGPVHAAVGGSLRLSVLMLRDGQPVYGAPVTVESQPVTTTASAQVNGPDAEDNTLTSLGVTPSLSGEVILRVSSAEQVVKEVTVLAHEASELAALELFKPPMKDDTEDDTKLPVLVQGRLRDGTPVWGVPALWNAQGNALDGTADVLEYKFRRGANTPVTAFWDGLEVAGAVEGTPLRVKEAGEASCANAGPSLWAVLAVLALALRRRAARAL